MNCCKYFKNTLFNAKFSAVSLYRVSRRHYLKNTRIGNIITVLIHRLNITLNGVDIAWEADIGPDFEICHSIGIVIGKCKAERGLRIYQNVTIGQREQRAGDGYPILGKNVRIYAGAVVIGLIRVGDNVNIGANSVVIDDVPDNCTAVGAPAKIVNMKTQ